MKLTHRQIEVFRAIGGSGQVTRAAEVLHTSQPTVSRELARLERVLGYPLFDRVRGRLQLTARGRALHEEVLRADHGLARISAVAEQLRQAAHLRLQLACLPALAHVLVPEALRLLASAEPTMQVSLEALESPHLEAALGEQRVDLGLVERREVPPGCNLTTLLVADEVVVLPNGHGLAGRERLAPEDLAGLSFVSLAPADPYRQQIDALFGQRGVSRNLCLDTTSAVAVCALVAQGLGVAIVNPLTALAMVGAGLVVRPLTVSIPFHVAMVRPHWRATHPLRAALEEALMEAVRGCLRQLEQLAPKERSGR